MLALPNRGSRAATPSTAQAVAQLISVYPAGRTLPDDFLRQDWGTAQRWMLPECLTNGVTPCDAIILDLGGRGDDDIRSSTATARRRAAGGFGESKAADGGSPE